VTAERLCRRLKKTTPPQGVREAARHRTDDPDTRVRRRQSFLLLKLLPSLLLAMDADAARPSDVFFFFTSVAHHAHLLATLLSTAHQAHSLLRSFSSTRNPALEIARIVDGGCPWLSCAFSYERARRDLSVRSHSRSRVKQLTRNRARLALPQVKTDFAGRREGAPLRLTPCRSRLERLRTLAADAPAKAVHRAARAESRVARWTRAGEREQRASRLVPGYTQWTLTLCAECTSARLSALTRLSLRLARLRTAHP
jgi:hypothetical protein